MFSLICAWINGWVNNHWAGDLRLSRPLWRHHNEQCVLYIVPAVVWGGEIRHPCTVCLSLSEIVIKIQENAIENVVWKMWLSCLGLSVLRHFDTKHFRFKRDGEIRPHTQPRTLVLFAICLLYRCPHKTKQRSHGAVVMETARRHFVAQPKKIVSLNSVLLQTFLQWESVVMGTTRRQCVPPW